MRFFLLILVCLSGPLASAAAQAPVSKDYSLICTNSGAQIALFGRAAEGKFHLRFLNAAGFSQFPIYTGVVTPGNLPALQQSAQDLAALGGDIEITWDLSRCEFSSQDPRLVLCGGLGEVVRPAGVGFMATNLSTATALIKNIDAQVEQISVNLALATKDARSSYYFLSLPFDPLKCEQ